MTDQSTMTYESFTRRVWQQRHALHVQCRNAKVTGIAVNYRDWINLVTDEAVGTPGCRLQARYYPKQESAWYWEDIPVITDSRLDVGTIVIRSEVQA